MPRHYTYPSKAQRDAAVEKRLRDAEAARLAGLDAPPPDLRYDRQGVADSSPTTRG